MEHGVKDKELKIRR